MIYRTMIWWRLITGTALASALATTTVAQDVTAGEKTFNVCRACHEIGDGAKNEVGPVLNCYFRVSREMMILSTSSHS